MPEAVYLFVQIPGDLIIGRWLSLSNFWFDLWVFKSCGKYLVAKLFYDFFEAGDLLKVASLKKPFQKAFIKQDLVLLSLL